MMRSAIALASLSFSYPWLPSVAITRPLSASRRHAAVPSTLWFEGRDPGDEPRDCFQGTPAAYGLPPIVSGSELLPVTVMVLVDGVPIDEARAALEAAKIPYKNLGIDLRLTLVAQPFPADGRRPGATGRSTLNDVAALRAARDLFPNRRRPAGFDLVYVLTGKDLWSGGGRGRGGAA